MLSGRLECDIELCETALYEEDKRLQQPDETNNNESVISEFQTFLDKNGIAPADVSSEVLANGVRTQRFSVVTKGESMSIDAIKQEIAGFAASYSPKAAKIIRKALDPVVYEVSYRTYTMVNSTIYHYVR